MRRHNFCAAGAVAVCMVTAVGFFEATAWAQADSAEAPVPTTPSAVVPTATCPDLGPYTAQIEQLNAALAEKESTVATLQGKLAKRDNHVQELERRLLDSADNNKRLLDELATRDKDRLKLAMALSVAQGDAKLTREELAKTEVAIRRASHSEKAKLEETKAVLQQSLETREADVTNLQVQLSQQEKKLNSTSIELNQANANRARMEVELRNKNAELARNESALARQRANMTLAAIGVAVALPIAMLLAYILYFGLRHAREESELHDGFLGAALALRNKSGHSHLSAIEHTLVGDLSGNRVLLINLRRWLRVAILLCLGGAVALSVAAVVALRNASFGEAHIDLIKSSAWQGLVGLFTPIGALIACVSLVQTKYRDAVSHCIAAGLVSAPKASPDAVTNPASGTDEKRAA